MADPRPTPLDTAPLDTAPAEDVVARVLDAQAAAVAAVQAVADPIREATDLVAGRLASGGRWLLAADVGTAGRVLDLVATDLVAEFGLDEAALRHGRVTDLAGWRPNGRDAVAVVATRSTPAVAAALDTARRARAGVVLVTTDVTTDGSTDRSTTPDVDVVIAPAVAPEPVRGVERLGAATALKAVLDALTTAVAAQLGRVHGDLPVDLVATDDHTRERVVAMVAELADVDGTAARRAAETTGFDVRIAVLSLAGGLTPAEAAMLASGHRTLRDALANLPRLPRG